MTFNGDKMCKCSNELHFNLGWRVQIDGFGSAFEPLAIAFYTKTNTEQRHT